MSKKAITEKSPYVIVSLLLGLMPSVFVLLMFLTFVNPFEENLYNTSIFYVYIIGSLSTPVLGVVGLYYAEKQKQIQKVPWLWPAYLLGLYNLVITVPVYFVSLQFAGVF